MRLFFALILCLLLATAIAAQEETQTPYEIALQRIEEARVTGATELDLTGLGLTELPPEIGSLSNLRHLYLSSNQLRSLPPAIGNLSSLWELYLHNNQLTSLPPEIGMLSNLRILSLVTNKLSSLPPEIGNLSNLWGLYLGDNQLTRLPSEIGNLRILQDLSLIGNQLSELPPEIANLKHLCFLDISWNQFEQLPIELAELHNLEQSYCRHGYDVWIGIATQYNPLISPPPDVIAQGTPAILEYLGNQAWWHLQRLILGGTGFVSLAIIGILGLRWRNNRGKEKKKNDS